MKYLLHKFSSPHNSNAYRDGWERTFATCRECGHPLADHGEDGYPCYHGAFADDKGWQNLPCNCGYRVDR